ncbi:amidohydrolase family protein [Breznakiella homolactica]|uniref:Amidohydrolase family protein n=1 Tax=Breznakiella homolactica TaxID=2798577 RepID=A0A7T8B894_9SPIR|nr:amidohydrolase family protein [Breznakiella homolactica]QQO08344.1 amidohydrolase family protein [Breznakiella homolactica]
MRVIDSHVHFPSEKIIDTGGADRPEGKAAGASMPGAPAPANPWLIEEKEKWKRAWRFPPEEKLDTEESIRRWKAECDSHDFLKNVVFVTAGDNEFAAELAEKDGRFIGYAHHDPLLPDAADRLEKALGSLRLRGYKLLGPQIDVPLNDKRFYPLWEIAQAREVPVLIHFGILGGAGGIANHININPLVIHDVAKDFPRLPIIIPHFGCGYVFETLNLCWACPNVCIDTSGSNQWMRWMPYELNLEILFRKYRETIGAGRILFGTDSSWFPRGFTDAYLDEQIRAMVYVGYSADELDRVLYSNAASLLKL